MRHLSKIWSRAWIFALVGACGFLLWVDEARLQRVHYVTHLVGYSTSADGFDAHSNSGYAQVQRELIVPERNEKSFRWIQQTQQMFDRHESRVRQVDYDNAPRGREVHSTSPYRWWFGSIAWVDHAISGRPLGLSIERAALYSDPLLHLIFLLAATLLVAWQWGRTAAVIVPVGLVAWFPLAGAFYPGEPDDRGLAAGLAIASVLGLLAGIQASWTPDEKGSSRSCTLRGRRWFRVSGVVGGLGLWVSLSVQAPIIIALVLGAVTAALVERRAIKGSAASVPPSLPWREWAWCGGVTVFLAYLLEYFPAHLASWRLDSIHPLHGLAWVGAGEILAQIIPRIRCEKQNWSRREVITFVLATASIALVPIISLKTGSQGFLPRDLLWARLSNLPEGAVAVNTREWLIRDGATPAFWATVSPLLLLGISLWLMVRGRTDLRIRVLIAVACAPAVMAAVFAFQQLSWWGVLDGTVLALLVAVVAGKPCPLPRSALWIGGALVGLIAIAGGGQLLPQRSTEASAIHLTPSESEELIERHLAHWLAQRGPQRTVYAPPHLTTTLAFYGGLRGIGTFDPENRVGFGASLMIAGAPTMEEVQAQLQSREVNYVVIPSWDRYFDEFAQLYLARNFSNRTSFFANELRHWNLPLWLRPIPYQIPVGGGFEGQSVLVFAVVPEQSPAAAASRLAEYFIEIGDLDLAGSTADGLRRFPGDVGALTARAQVQIARGDAEGSAQTIDALLSRLSAGADRYLPWDRRVSLAMVLARANRVDLAREHTGRCLAQLTDEKLRSLSTGSLYNLMILSHLLGLDVSDPQLHRLALSLLPVDLRKAVEE